MSKETKKLQFFLFFRTAEAEISFKKASEYTKKLVSTDHTNTIDIYNAVATYSKIVTAYFNAGMTVESEPWLNLEDSLFNVLKSCSDADPTVIDTLKAEVDTHRNGAEPNDDLTMMCLRVN